MPINHVVFYLDFLFNEWEKSTLAHANYVLPGLLVETIGDLHGIIAELKRARQVKLCQDPERPEKGPGFRAWAP